MESQEVIVQKLSNLVKDIIGGKKDISELKEVLQKDKYRILINIHD